MCGEHTVVSGDSLWSVGSSPHVRGALSSGSFVRRLSGIIPACAGSTDNRDVSRVARRDHPRMCGEHGVAHGT